MDEPTPLTDYLINRSEQIGVTAASPQDALKAAMAGTGTSLAVSYNVSPRPPPASTTAPTLSTAQIKLLQALTTPTTIPGK